MLFMITYQETDNCYYWCDQFIFIEYENKELFFNKLKNIIEDKVIELLEDKNYDKDTIMKHDIKIFDHYIPLGTFLDYDLLSFDSSCITEVETLDYYIFETYMADGFTFHVNTISTFEADNIKSLKEYINKKVYLEIDSLKAQYKNRNLKKGKIIHLVKEQVKDTYIKLAGEEFFLKEFVNTDDLSLHYEHKLFHIKDYAEKNKESYLQQELKIED